MVRNPDGTFPKGVSGNPGGKKKAEFNLEDLIDSCFTKSDWKQALKAMKPRFLRGDIKVVEFVMDRRFGKALQKNEHTGADGKDVTIHVVYEADNEKGA